MVVQVATATAGQPYAPFQTETKDGLGLDPPTGANRPCS